MNKQLWKLILCLVVVAVWTGFSVQAPEWGAVNVAYADDDSDSDSDSDSDDDGEMITVSGNSEFSDCGVAAGTDFALSMSGVLEGCLAIFPKSSECDELEGFDKYTERGREVFDGTIKGVGSGKFKTRYIVEGIYASGFCDALAVEDPNAFALQLAGGCDHKVFGKRGDLKDIDGLITFLDFIPDPEGQGGATNFYYFGHLNLDND